MASICFHQHWQYLIKTSICLIDDKYNPQQVHIILLSFRTNIALTDYGTLVTICGVMSYQMGLFFDLEMSTSQVELLLRLYTNCSLLDSQYNL